MSEESLELLKGTLDIVILKTLETGPRHGYGISRWVRDATGEDLSIDEGALYPALRRLEKRGFVESEWGVSDTGRDAKFYRLTRDGRAELESVVDNWERYVSAMSRVLRAASGA